MPSLFDPIQVGELTLPNRIIMAPMSRSRADDKGKPRNIVAKYYAQRASAGLIISESIYISDMAKGYPRTPGMVTRDHVKAWKKVTKSVHSTKGRIFAQLYHTGRASSPELLPDGALPVAPSAVAINGMKQTKKGKKPFVTPRALNIDEIPQIASQFAEAADRALQAGFDGVEIHAASGYLIHQFLDASANKREDAYGGAPENRIRFLLDIIDRVTNAIGKTRVGVKIAPRIKFNDVVEPDAEDVYPLVAQELSARDIAYLHVARQEGYAADELRGVYNGVFLLGSGLDFDSATTAISSGAANAAVFGKLYIANPDLVRRFQEGLPLAQADPATIYSGGAKGYIDYRPHP